MICPIHFDVFSFFCQAIYNSVAFIHYLIIDSDGTFCYLNVLISSSLASFLSPTLLAAAASQAGLSEQEGLQKSSSSSTPNSILDPESIETHSEGLSQTLL